MVASGRTRRDRPVLVAASSISWMQVAAVDVRRSPPSDPRSTSRAAQLARERDRAPRRNVDFEPKPPPTSGATTRTSPRGSRDHRETCAEVRDLRRDYSVTRPTRTGRTNAARLHRAGISRLVEALADARRLGEGRPCRPPRASDVARWFDSSWTSGAPSSSAARVDTRGAARSRRRRLGRASRRSRSRARPPRRRRRSGPCPARAASGLALDVPSPARRTERRPGRPRRGPVPAHGTTPGGHAFEASTLLIRAAA